MSLFELSLRVPLARFELALDVASDARRLALFGASGAGKTTTLECIAGWRKPRAGRIEVAGRALFDRARGIDVPVAERAIGLVPQDALLFPHWDVQRNVTAGARARGPGAAAALERALAVLELEELRARDVRTLSGGERQRVALARALCAEPSLLLLDEPLGSLDVPLRRRILPYLIRVADELDVPLVLVTHDATEVRAVCDEVVVLERGAVVAHGPPDVVLRASRVAGDFENVLRGRVVERGGGIALVELGGGARLRVPGARGSARLDVGREAVVGLRAEDVLVSLRPIEGLSARNLLPARVSELERAGDDVTLRATLGSEGTGPELCVALTAESSAELGLERGKRIHLVAKTQACHVLGWTR